MSQQIFELYQCWKVETSKTCFYKQTNDYLKGAYPLSVGKWFTRLRSLFSNKWSSSTTILWYQSVVYVTFSPRGWQIAAALQRTPVLTLPQESLNLACLPKGILTQHPVSWYLLQLDNHIFAMTPELNTSRLT